MGIQPIRLLNMPSLINAVVGTIPLRRQSPGCCICFFGIVGYISLMPLAYTIDGCPLKICSREDCPHLGQAQLASNFHNKKSEPDGLYPQCRDCHRNANKKAIRTPEGRAAQKKWWGTLGGILAKSRQHAKARGIAFDLTVADFPDGIPTVCPVLGIPLQRNEGGHGPGDNSPSFDRIDSTRGYFPGNVIIVSNLANSIKNKATPEQLMKVAEFYANLIPAK